MQLIIKQISLSYVLFQKISILDPRALVFYHVTDGDKSSGEPLEQALSLFVVG